METWTIQEKAFMIACDVFLNEYTLDAINISLKERVFPSSIIVCDGFTDFSDEILIEMIEDLAKQIIKLSNKVYNLDRGV